MNKPKILVIGPFCNLSGYSEHARTLVDSLIESQDKIDLYLQDTQWAASSRSSKYETKYLDLISKTVNLLQTQPKTPDGNVNIAGLFDMTYQVRPPNEFAQMSTHDIGVTAALETTFAPAEWVAKCNMMKHILVVSDHAKANLKNTSDDAGVRISTPISVIPFGHDTSLEKDDVYKDVNITTSFNFLTVLQMAPRKNFDMMLSWYIEQFGDNEDVGLFIKTHQHNNSTIDFYSVKQRIQSMLNKINRDRKCKVYLIHGSLTEEQMESLYNPEHIDCYITTTHGEGFGIPIFKAACNNIPIIATNWSGHLDFLRAPSKNRAGKVKHKSHFLKVDYDLDVVRPEHLMPGLITEGCIWAYPREGSFKKNMKFIYNNKESFTEDANNLASYLVDKYSIENIRNKYTDFNTQQISPYMKMVEEYENEVDSLLDDLI
jgi:glycosyltransferase involved in cell wall biosynthesis